MSISSCTSFGLLGSAHVHVKFNVWNWPTCNLIHLIPAQLYQVSCQKSTRIIMRRDLECTCFQSVISSWSSVCWRSSTTISCPVEFVTWILSPWTEVNFEITTKFPFGWCCGGYSCTYWCSWNNGYCIVWENYTCANCKCYVIYGYITLVTRSSDAFKYNLTYGKDISICKNRIAACVSLSYVWDWLLLLNRYQVMFVVFNKNLLWFAHPKFSRQSW